MTKYLIIVFVLTYVAGVLLNEISQTCGKSFWFLINISTDKLILIFQRKLFPEPHASALYNIKKMSQINWLMISETVCC